MSHNLIMDTAAKAKDGRPMFKDEKALRAACKELGIADPPKVMRALPHLGTRECFEVTFPKRASDTTHWHSPVLIDVETGADVFDNYSPYTPQHVEVRKGRKRAGEGGQWGDIQRLWELDEAYLTEATYQVVAELQAVALQQGEPITEHKIENGGRLQSMLIGHPTPQAGTILQ